MQALKATGLEERVSIGDHRSGGLTGAPTDQNHGAEI